MTSLTLHQADASHWANSRRNKRPRKAYCDTHESQLSLLSAQSKGRRMMSRFEGGKNRIPSTFSHVESLPFVCTSLAFEQVCKHLSHFTIFCCLFIIFFLRDLCADHTQMRSETDEKLYMILSLQLCYWAKKVEHSLPNPDCQRRRRKPGRKMRLLFF